MPKPAFQLARHAAWIAAAALLVPGPGFAQDAVPSAVTEAIAALLPNARPDQISPAPVPGLYEVRIGVQVVYVSRDGKYLVRGDVVDVAERRNLTELKRREARADLVKELSERSMIVFSPESAESPESAGSVKHTVTVFTDVDCAYCARLHRQITEYNDLGIEVRYLAFPRAGIGSASTTRRSPCGARTTLTKRSVTPSSVGRSSLVPATIRSSATTCWGEPSG